MNFFDTDLVTKTNMKTSVIILLLVLLSSFTSEKESEEYLIMQTMVDYVDEWDVKIEKKYNNTDFLNEISVTKQSCEMWGDSVMKGIHGGLCIHDSFMLVEGLEFDLTYVTSTLEKTNRRRLERSFRDKQPGEGIIRFSYPDSSLASSIKWKDASSMFPEVLSSLLPGATYVSQPMMGLMPAFWASR